MELPHLTLVLGGARSGKSRHAEALIEALPPPWTYIATAQAYDDEMRARIAEHRERRSAGWVTVDAPLALPEAIRAVPAGQPVLVDCLTLWLTNLLLAEHDTAAAGRALTAACAGGLGPGRAGLERGRPRHRAGECAGAALPRRGRPAAPESCGTGRPRGLHGRRPADAGEIDQPK